MKQIIMSLLFVMAAMGLNAQNLFVGSYNIRYQNNSDAKNGNSWQQRCPRVCGIINFEHSNTLPTRAIRHSASRDIRLKVAIWRFRATSARNISRRCS